MVPGETIKLRFALWDMGDELYDPTALIDHFRWTVRESSGPVTVPVQVR